MLSTLLVSAAVACAGDAEVPARVEPPLALELVLRVEESRLTALNPTDRVELLVLADGPSGRRATIAVPPRTQLEWRFLPRAVAGLELTVLARGDEGLCTSGPWPLDRLSGEIEPRTTWFESSHGHVHAWTRDGARWSALESQSGSAPQSSCAPPAQPAPARHVPVITPNEGQHGDLPPRLEKRPLPPV